MFSVSDEMLTRVGVQLRMSQHDARLAMQADCPWTIAGHSHQHTHTDAIAEQRYRPGPKDLDSGMMAHEAYLLRIVVHRDGRIPLIASWSGLYEWAQLDRRVNMTGDWVWEALNKLLCLGMILQLVPRSL